MPRFKPYSWVYLTVLLILLNGCSVTKSLWYDAGAYYNTYFNAQKSYDAFVKKLKPISYTTKTDELPRIYTSYHHLKHNKDAQKALDKAFKVIRQHKKSKYFTKAIAMVGKIYYYERKYFDALNKFEEYEEYALNNAERKDAILWQSLTKRELNVPNNAIEQITDVVNINKTNWKTYQIAELVLLSAELLAHNGDIEEAKHQLEEHIEGVKNSFLKSNAYYLLGELQVASNEDEKAYISYQKARQVTENKQQYFDITLKLVRSAYKTFKLDYAAGLLYELLEAGVSDENTAIIEYELAQIDILNGDLDIAIENLESIITNTSYKLSKSLKAQIYNTLGDIYYYYDQNYEASLDYYQLAVEEKANKNTLPKTYHADVMATTVNKYINNQKQLNKINTLLLLGQADSTYVDEWFQKKLEVRNTPIENDKRNQPNNNIENDIDEDEKQNAGFLYYLNPTLVQQELARFNEVWNNVPNVDNWRYGALAQSKEIDEEEKDDSNVSPPPPQETTPEDAPTIAKQMGIKKTDIPTTEDEIKNLTDKKVYLFFDIATLFLFDMQEYDSALVYYHHILKKYPNHTLVTKTEYSIAETYYRKNMMDSSQVWIERLSDRNPPFSIKPLLNKLNLTTDSISTINEKMKYDDMSLLLNALNDMSPMERAKKIENWVKENVEHPLSAPLLYQSVMIYIEQAKQDSLYQSLAPQWLHLTEICGSHVSDIKNEIEIQDSTITDSTTAHSDDDITNEITAMVNDSRCLHINDYYPYKNEKWIHIRQLLNYYMTRYPKQKNYEQIFTLSTLVSPLYTTQ